MMKKYMIITLFMLLLSLMGACSQKQDVEKEEKNPEEPTCMDGVQNQEESDIDCGGSCVHCETGASCILDTDCVSDYCNENICS